MQSFDFPPLQNHMHPEQPREGRAIREGVSGSTLSGVVLQRALSHIQLLPAVPLRDLLDQLSRRELTMVPCEWTDDGRSPNSRSRIQSSLVFIFFAGA